MNLIEDFRSAMKVAGLDWAGQISPDGKLHRFKPEGDKSDSGWYVLHADGPVAGGSFGCWRRQLKQNWHSGNGHLPQGKELYALKQQWAAAEAQRAADEQERHLRMAERAVKEIGECSAPSRDHPYIQSKQVYPVGPLKENSDSELVLCLQDAAGKVWSYQTIDSLGDKLFMPGGRVQGCFYPIDERQDGPLVICEGYATGATVYESTGWAVVCAMNCGNIMPVCKALREKYPTRTLIIAADNDRFTEGKNPGLEKAEEAVKQCSALLALAVFSNPESRGTDFNDLAAEEGISSVRRILDAAYPCPLSVLTFDQIESIPITDQDKLLGDHLLNRGSTLVIAGQGGTGKSRLVYQMLASFYSGAEKFLTFDIHPGARNSKWLVLQVENSVRRLKDERRSISAFLANKYPKFNDLVRVLTPVTEQDTFVNLDNPDNLMRLQKTIEYVMPDGIIFDSLYDFWSGDLNKDMDMRQALTAITRLGRYRNPKRAIVVLHHALTGVAGAAKSSGFDRASFVRNSKVIYNWARAQINLAPMLEDSNDQLSISCAKCSDGREFQGFAAKLNPDTLIYECDENVDVVEWAKGIRTGKKGDPLVNSDRVRELCDVAGSYKPDLARAISNECGCAKPNAYRYIKEAEMEKLIIFSMEQKRYFRG